MFELKKATRKSIKIKMGITGASGSGKTYSALLLAKGLVGDWRKIAVIDTENGSASLYSDLGEYLILDMHDFSPKNYINAISFITKNHPEIECIIIDSVSHAWSGKGGFLDMHQKHGGKFQDWAKTTPIYREFLSAITQSPTHVICCLRAKSDYVHDKDDNGRAKIEKVGLKADLKEGFEYELTVSFRINQDHLTFADKDRTSIFSDPVPFIITEETGELVKQWIDSGEKVGDIEIVYNHIKKLWGDHIPKEKKIEIMRDLNLRAGKVYYQSDIKEMIHYLNDKKTKENALQMDLPEVSEKDLQAGFKE